MIDKRLSIYSYYDERLELNVLSMFGSWYSSNIHLLATYIGIFACLRGVDK